MNIKINNKLVEYIEKEIFPLYNRNEEGHRLQHITTVIEKSLKLSREYDVNINMVYTIAAYHDLGHYIDPNRHEIISAEIFMKDEFMEMFFYDEQRKVIKEAIEDHRASTKHNPRNIYGMIVSMADRMIIDVDDAIKRAYFYGKKNYMNLSNEEQAERVYKYLNEKYGENGYAKVYLKDEEYEKKINELRISLSDKENFMNRVRKIAKGI